MRIKRTGIKEIMDKGSGIRTCGKSSLGVLTCGKSQLKAGLYVENLQEKDCCANSPGNREQKWTAWICAAGNRAVRTAVQALAAAFGTGCMISGIHWKEALIQAVLAGIFSLLTSVAGLPELEKTMEGTQEDEEKTEEVRENTTREEGKVMEEVEGIPAWKKGGDGRGGRDPRMEERRGDRRSGRETCTGGRREI